MSFLKLRELMQKPCASTRNNLYIAAIRAIEDKEEQMLACDYFLAHGFKISKKAARIKETLPIFRSQIHDGRKTVTQETRFLDKIQTLYLWTNFKRMEDVVLPPTVENLHLKTGDWEESEKIVFPEQLRRLTFKHISLKCAKSMVFPENITKISFEYCWDFESLMNIVWPESLQTIFIKYHGGIYHGQKAEYIEGIVNSLNFPAMYKNHDFYKNFITLSKSILPIPEY